MRIYVGRWDLLPEDWDGDQGLNEKPKYDIIDEVARQRVVLYRPSPMDSYGCLVGSYTPKEFEATFNNDLWNKLNTKDYWIKIF